MRFRVSISLLPARAERHVVEAATATEALRAVLGFDGVAEVFRQRPMAGVVISVFPENEKKGGAMHTLTVDELRTRWAIRDFSMKTLCRRLARSGLRPCMGAGRSMVFRLADVLSAEERGGAAAMRGRGVGR